MNNAFISHCKQILARELSISMGRPEGWEVSTDTIHVEDYKHHIHPSKGIDLEEGIFYTSNKRFSNYVYVMRSVDGGEIEARTYESRGGIHGTKLLHTPADRGKEEDEDLREFEEFLQSLPNSKEARRGRQCYNKVIE